MTLNFSRLDAAPVDPRADEVMVEARDGVKLATDIYMPEHGDRHPAVLVRLPYDKSGRYTFMPQIAPMFTDRGYAFVVQDVAGKFRSEGETVPYVREIQDGYDAIDWIVGQRWSNGVVGMWGDSYYGFTQWAAVASGHPALRAIVPRVTSADLADMRRGTRWDEGVPQLYAADYLAHYWLDKSIYFFDVDWSHRPLIDVFDAAYEAIGRRSQATDEFFAGPLRAGAFDMFGEVHPFDVLGIPVLHGGGWFDNIAPDQMKDFMTLQTRQRSSSPQYLLMDSTDHENYHLDDLPIVASNDHDSDEAALARMLPRYIGPALDFFDLHLRQQVGSAIARVRWHLGHVGWQDADRWPPPESRQISLYLRGFERATRDADGGGLALESPSAGETTWTHDPAALVPSTVEDPFSFLREDPDERSVEAREDVATFTMEPLVRPLDLSGPVAVTATFGSTAPSAMVFAKLVDVGTDGSARMLTRGQTSVATANGDAPVHLALGHVGYRVQRGHRLRLHIASSDFPLYSWHPGTAENPWTATMGEPSRQALISSRGQPAMVSLWVTNGAVEP